MQLTLCEDTKLHVNLCSMFEGSHCVYYTRKHLMNVARVFFIFAAGPGLHADGQGSRACATRRVSRNKTRGWFVSRFLFVTGVAVFEGLRISLRMCVLLLLSRPGRYDRCVYRYYHSYGYCHRYLKCLQLWGACRSLE